MSPLPEWAGAQRIAAHYGIPPEYIEDMAAAKWICSYDLPRTPRSDPWSGPTFYNTQDIECVFSRFLKRHERRIEEAMQKHLSELDEDNGGLPW